MQKETLSEDILSEDILSSEDDYVRAEPGKRFLNYFIDIIVFYVLAIAGAVVYFLASPAALETADSQGNGLLDRLIYLVIYALYMGLMETLFKGKSIGKFLTGTRAVNLDGSRISASTAFARGFCRAVPFCAFSAFGSPSNPWQDKWTNTMVIVENRR